MYAEDKGEKVLETYKVKLYIIIITIIINNNINNIYDNNLYL